MLIVILCIFVGDTKTIFGYNSGAPLMWFFQNLDGHKIEKFTFGFPEKVVFSQKVVRNSRTKCFLKTMKQNFFYHLQTFRSCRPEELCKKYIFKKIHQILRKTPVSESLFHKVAVIQSAAFSRRNTLAKVFRMNFRKFL